jgi:hypothetical protein
MFLAIDRSVLKKNSNLEMFSQNQPDLGKLFHEISFV